MNIIGNDHPKEPKPGDRPKPSRKDGFPEPKPSKSKKPK